MTPQEFYQLLAQQGIELTDRQKDQFERYFELLVEWNEKNNLTAITEKNVIYLKHFYDSIAPVLQGLIDNQELKLLDIGAGAGFPSLPMKIICPQLDVTIIDSLNKRINFLKLLAEELGLELTVEYGDFSEKKARELTFAYEDRTDVFVCASDLMAIGAMRALMELDVFHPVCGFDGIPLMSYAGKQMNTVKQDFAKISAVAVDEMERLLHGDTGRNTVLGYELVRMRYEDMMI